MKKEIVFAAKINTAEFNNQLKDMQERIIKAMGGMSTFDQANMGNRMQKLGLGTPGQPNQLQQDQAVKRSAREVEGIIKDQWKQVRELNKEMDTRLNKIQAIRKEEEALLKAGKDATSETRKRGEVEMELSKKQAEHRLRMQSLNESITAREKLDQARPQGLNRLLAAYTGAYTHSAGGLGGIAQGVGAAGSAASRMMGGGLGMAGMGIGAVAAGLQLADPIARQVAGQDRVMAGAQGSAIQGLSGPLADLYSGNARNTMLFNKERTMSMQRAMEETNTNRSWDKASPWSGLASKTAGGAAVGGIGTAWLGPGALGGALVGGAAGFAKGSYDIAANSHSRDTVLSQFGSQSASQRLESSYSKDLSDRMNENFAAEKARDPLKTLADQQYTQNMSSNLAFQRQTGMQNADFYGEGGFLEKGTNAGFSREEMMGQSQGIFGAGGSTRAARGSADFAARLGRGDISNASSIIGKLSGNLGSAAATESATIKVLSEGVKLGLDKSEFREEQRKFADVTAMAVVRSGATDADSAAEAAKEFGAYFGKTPTMQEIGGTAAQNFVQGATAETGTAGGAIKAAKMQSNGLLGKLDFNYKAALSQMSIDQMTTANPVVQAAADSLGVDPSEIVKQMKTVQMDSVTKRSSTQKELERIQGMSDEEFEKDPAKNSGKLIAMMAAENGSSVAGMSPAEMTKLGRRVRAGGNIKDDYTADAVAGSIGDTGATGTGRMEDVDLAAVASQQKMVNDQFTEMAPLMEAAATAALNMNKTMFKMMTEMNEVIASGGKVTPEMAKRWATMGSSDSTAGGKPGNQKAK